MADVSDPVEAVSVAVVSICSDVTICSDVVSGGVVSIPSAEVGMCQLNNCCFILNNY